MKVGPINAFNGFPVWYKDENGLRLQLNVDPTDPILWHHICRFTKSITTRFFS